MTKLEAVSLELWKHYCIGKYTVAEARRLEAIQRMLLRENYEQLKRDCIGEDK